MTDHIVCFDVETTGLNIKDNYIIQLAVVKFSTLDFSILDTRNWYIVPINRNFTIEPSAFDTHHLSKDFILKRGVTLRSIYKDLRDFISGCDTLTYNGNHYDIQFLIKDLKEYGLEIDMGRCYDSFVVESHYNSRKLEDVYRRYTGKDIVGAHDALNDVKATIEVFKHQMEKWGREGMELEEFDMVTGDGMLRIVEGRGVCMRGGKYKDYEVTDVCRKDPSYMKWLFTVCSEKTKQVIQKEYYKKYPKKN